MMDAGASIINLFAVGYALKPADKEHRFGHGKAEALAGLAQSAFITGSAVLVLLQGINRLLHPAASLAIARAVPDVIDVHDLRTRQSGHHWFMQLHLELPATLTLADAHARGEQVRLAIIERYPQADVLVHKDPA